MISLCCYLYNPITLVAACSNIITNVENETLMKLDRRRLESIATNVNLCKEKILKLTTSPIRETSFALVNQKALAPKEQQHRLETATTTLAVAMTAENVNSAVQNDR